MSCLTDITEIGHICVCDSPKQQEKCQGTGRTCLNSEMLSARRQSFCVFGFAAIFSGQRERQHVVENTRIKLSDKLIVLTALHK